MKRMVQAVIICCWFFIGVVPVVSAAEIISRITGQELVTILKEEGFAPTLDKPSVISMKIEGFKVLFFVADDHESIQAYGGFKSEKGTMSKVNEWNMTKRYSHAYLDKDGDPVIEFDLDLSGGVSKKRIIDFIKTVRFSIPIFARHVFGAD